MKSTEDILIDLENYIKVSDKIDSSISASSIAWHIEHSLKVINQISIALERSKPEEYKWKFNRWWLIILITKTMPRGRAKAPKGVIPEGEITVDSLKKSFEKTKLRLSKMGTFNVNAHFAHPYFGLLNLKSTKTFLAIHTKHHLKIIEDICRKQKAVGRRQMAEGRRQ